MKNKYLLFALIDLAVFAGCRAWNPGLSVSIPCPQDTVQVVLQDSFPVFIAGIVDTVYLPPDWVPAFGADSVVTDWAMREPDTTLLADGVNLKIWETPERVIIKTEVVDREIVVYHRDTVRVLVPVDCPAAEGFNWFAWGVAGAMALFAFWRKTKKK